VDARAASARERIHEAHARRQVVGQVDVARVVVADVVDVGATVRSFTLTT
jgi:hypothetical protein